MAETPLTVVEMVLSERARCPVCGVQVEFEPYYCQQCHAVHHRECWHYNEGCAVYGCNPTTKEPQTTDPMVVLPSTKVKHCLNKVASGAHEVKEGAWTLIRAFLSLPVHGRLYVWLVSGLLMVAVLSFSNFLWASRQMRNIFTFSSVALFLFSTGHLCFASLFISPEECFYPKPKDNAPVKHHSDKELERLFALNPKNTNIAEALAYQAQTKGHYDRARELYEMCLQKNPYSVYYRQRLNQLSDLESGLDGGKECLGNSKIEEKPEPVA